MGGIAFTLDLPGGVDGYGRARLGRPRSFGWLSFAGLAGSLALIVGAAGATVSILQLNVAGLGSTLPVRSIARTSKLWLPSASDG